MTTSPQPLAGRHALVTGGARGIGLASARGRRQPGQPGPGADRQRGHRRRSLGARGVRAGRSGIRPGAGAGEQRRPGGEPAL
ncbi:hypothetical protein G6F52_014054 [Rhizopus delemar]|nr:hypothetical protein G6F52_014054 [Rhizopus delemar]